MGSKFCTGGSQPQGFNSPEDEQTFYYQQKEKSIQHTRPLRCRDPVSQKTLEQYQKQLKIKKSLYKDAKFPTDPIILKSKKAELQCTYQRPYQFLNQVMKGDIYRLIDEHQANAENVEVRDQVLQYFGVFLCFLADKPNLIKKIIKTQENSYGIHCIEAYVQNELKTFFIDDYILCNQSKPLFSQPYKMIYMWTCLLEKAWLKIKSNSAKRVEHNSPQQVFDVFLPLPIQKIYLQSGLKNNPKQKIINTFQNFDRSKQKGYIVTSRKDPEHDIGLSDQKHFYLIDTFTLGEKRLFYLRNPCGQANFRGFYQEIPEEIQNKLYQRQFMSIKPGNFILQQQEFIQQIQQIMVIDYIQGNTLTSYSFQIENNDQFFIGFETKHNGLMNLCVNQFNEKKQKIYAPLMYHVIKLNDRNLLGGAENEQGCFGIKKTYLFDNFTEHITPGKYLIRLKKKQQTRNISGLKTSLLCNFKDNIKFDILSTEQSALKWKQFLQEQGKKKLNQKIQKQGRVGMHGDIAHVICWIGDIIFIYIQKKNQKKREVFLEVCFPELMNLQCISHPQIRRDNQYRKLNFEDNLLIIFEKVVLTEETHIRKYDLQAF